jgi:hypothetical protein
MFFFTVLLGLAGCDSGSELTPFPSSISWGEIDFRQPLPETGYSPKTIDLNNNGEKEVSSISIDRLDLNIDYDCPGSSECNRLCLQGFDKTPADLGSLDAGSSYSFVVAVCDYVEETGERDEEISGQIEISHSGTNSPITVDWSFTPVFLIEGNDDTGR